MDPEPSPLSPKRSKATENTGLSHSIPLSSYRYRTCMLNDLGAIREVSLHTHTPPTPPTASDKCGALRQVWADVCLWPRVTHATPPPPM